MFFPPRIADMVMFYGGGCRSFFQERTYLLDEGRGRLFTGEFGLPQIMKWFLSWRSTNIVPGFLPLELYSRLCCRLRNNSGERTYPIFWRKLSQKKIVEDATNEHVLETWGENGRAISRARDLHSSHNSIGQMKELKKRRTFTSPNIGEHTVSPENEIFLQTALYLHNIIKERDLKNY